MAFPSGETMGSSGHRRPTLQKFIQLEPAVDLLKNLACPWVIAGGWAIDLFLDRLTRKHGDIDIAVFRQDQLTLQEFFLSRKWSLEKAENDGLRSWERGELLQPPLHETWCRHPADRSRDLEVLLNEQSAGDFLFRRDARIHLPVEKAFLLSRSGIPILAPEIVLLYKSRHGTLEKNQQDFVQALVYMEVECCQWLYDSLALLDPRHAWLHWLKRAP